MASWNTNSENAGDKHSSVTGIQFKYYGVGDNTRSNDIHKIINEQNDIESPKLQTEKLNTQSMESNSVCKPQDTGACLDVRKVSYSVTVRYGPWWKGACFRKKHVKVILNNVTIRVNSGEVTAVLGNSGSGKTTLLDVIAGRTVGSYEGAVTYAGQPLSPQMFRKYAGYVIQADRMLPDLTVKEVLTYTARLKFLSDREDVNIEERVNLALSQMGMRHLADSIVGGVVKRGISGGEKRRLSIATQLIQDPAIILLDEPTTGLDSFTAHNLIKTLSALAKDRDKIILLSIHQPRSDIFRLFDRIGILSLGEMVYFGPRDQLVSHFTGAGFPCPTYVNPLDHYVDISSIDNRSTEQQTNSKSRVDSLKQYYTQSAPYSDMIGQIQTNNSTRASDWSRSDDVTCNPSCACVQQTWILLSRMNVNIWRNKIGMFARVMTLFTFGFLCLLFLGRLNDDLTTIQDRTGLFFESISAAPLVGMLNAIALFPTMREVFHRESGDGLYKTPPFLTAYYIHILPFNLLSSMIFCCVVYWGCGLYPEASRFFIFYGVIAIIHYLGELLTVLFMAVFSHVPLAQSVTTLILAATSLLATGLLVTSSQLMAMIDWIKYISFYKYCTEILVANEYQGLTFNCDQGDNRCDHIDGDAYLEIFFPDAVANMRLNSLVLVVNVVCFWVLDIVVYSIRGVQNLY